VIETWLWTDLPKDLGSSTPPWYLVIGLPVVGAMVVIAARRLLPGDGGHSPLLGFAGHGPTKLAHAPGIALAALGTLGFGAVLGPEAPLIALGSVAGVAIAVVAKLGEKPTAVLGNAGSFSAISALFGGPIVGGLFMLEGGLSMGAALLPVLVPGFVAAAIGYVLFIGLGDWGGLQHHVLTVPNLPTVHGTHIASLFLAVAIGIIAALLVTGIRALGKRVDTDGLKRLSMPALLLAGGLAVGLLAQIASWLGANSQDVLFSGQTSIPAVISQTSTKVVLVLLVAKGLAYAISLGCGFRGGPVFPAIFLGSTLATFPIIWFGASPTLAVAIGAAAGMAALTRMLLTPIVLAALLTGSAGTATAPAAVLAASAAWLAMQALDRRSAAAPAGQPAAQPAARAAQ
jgi:H+/Cl- antiporter ClcA